MLRNALSASAVLIRQCGSGLLPLRRRRGRDEGKHSTSAKHAGFEPVRDDDGKE